MASTAGAAAWSGWQQPAAAAAAAAGWATGQVAGYSGFAAQQQQTGYTTPAVASQAQAGYAAQQQGYAAAQPQQAAYAQQAQDTSAYAQQAGYAAAQPQASYAQAQAGYSTAQGYAQAQPQQLAAADEGVGNESEIVISGCSHPTVGGIVRGNFVLAAENHGKPAYRRDAQVNGLDVMIYYWDERDGPNFCGWWFGPRIGGDQVWAYHPSRNAQTPPKGGWKVPYDGAVDPTLVISAKASQAVQQGQWGNAAYAQRYAQQAQTQQVAAQAQAWQQPQQAQQTAQDQYTQQAAAQQQMWYGQQAAAHPQAAQQQQFQQQAWAQQPVAAQAAQAQAYGAYPQQLQYQQQMQEMALKQQQEEQLRLQQQQQLEMQRRMQEDRQKKIEEANQRRLEEQKRRMEEVRRQQEEQRASVAIRKAIQKVRTAIPTTFEEATFELQQVMQQELANCGSQAQRVQEEAQKGLEQAHQRVEQLKEQQRRAEEMRQENERKLQEAQERAEQLMKELEIIIEGAEAAAKELKEEGAPLEDAGLSFDKIMETAKTVEDTSTDAREKTKACTDFILANGTEMKVPDLPGRPQELKAALQRLLQRVNEATRLVEETVKGAADAREKALRKTVAQKTVEGIKTLFTKYDADKDKVLNKREVTKYVKDEYKFALPAATLDLIWKVFVPEGSKGVKFEDFQRLKVAAGVARERVKDGERRAARLDREKKVADLKSGLQEKVDAAAKEVAGAEELVAKAEEAAKPLPTKGKAIPSAEMIKIADEVDAMNKDARENTQTVKGRLSTLTEVAPAELKGWMATEARQLELKLMRFEARLSRVSNISTRFRDEGKRKEVDELRDLERQAAAMLRYHQSVTGLNNDKLFDAFAKDEEGHIKEADFLSFFQSCEQRKAAAKEADAEGEQTEEAEVENGNAEVPAGPSTEALARLFRSLDEDEQGFVTKEQFLQLVRIYMKVVKESVLTEGHAIGGSDIVRRLDLGEVVEVLEGPTKEESDILRVRAKALKDDAEGWVSLSSNQGTPFLEEGGNVFRVLKDTVLTDSFELEGAAKESPKRSKDTTRKLKEGELVEVREWARREESSGLLRMKCRAKADGAVGWVTVTGQNGVPLVQVV